MALFNVATEFNWPVPPGVQIGMTNRHGGCSTMPYDSLNLALHVGDQVKDVLRNRQRVIQAFNLPMPPRWLNQIHGTHVVTLSESAPTQLPQTADASYTRHVGQVCAVMTADCLPILCCNRAGTEVAALHAGWRGLCAGIIEATLAKFDSSHAELSVYIGPAIGPDMFQVGHEVRDAFIQVNAEDSVYFREDSERYLADLAGLARSRLLRAGVVDVYSADICTSLNSSDYFSYRQQGTTGRMASFIWMNT